MTEISIRGINNASTKKGKERWRVRGKWVGTCELAVLLPIKSMEFCLSKVLYYTERKL